MSCSAFVRATVLDRSGATFEGCVKEEFDNVSDKSPEICSTLKRIAFECGSGKSVTSELDPAFDSNWTPDSDNLEKVFALFGPKTRQLCDQLSVVSRREKRAIHCDPNTIFKVWTRFEACRSTYNESIVAKVKEVKGHATGTKHLLDRLCKDFPAETQKCLEITRSCKDKEDEATKIERIINETNKITAALGFQCFKQCFYRNASSYVPCQSSNIEATLMLVIFLVGLVTYLK